jgi:hypothetical protein
VGDEEEAGDSSMVVIERMGEIQGGVTGEIGVGSGGVVEGRL